MQELAPGGQLGAYRILSVIGRGGMGVVYLAEDAGLGRHVALKVLAPQFSADGGFRNRFERESRLAASLDHPNVVPVFDAGEIDGVLFIAMRYVAGPDLRTVLDNGGRFDVTRAISISAQLASALDAAHELGLIHRDVKPGNVLLAAGYGSDGGEHVYLTDFGLTKRSSSKSGLTQLGQLVGTIDYIAPEQITGGAVDGRADIYALGCAFFEMLAGKPPFERDTDLATMAAHIHEPPPSLLALRPDLPPATDALMAHVLAKDPEERFPTASAFVRQARHDMVGGSSPSTAAVSGAAETVIFSPSTLPQEGLSSQTVLADSSVPVASEQLTTMTSVPSPAIPPASQPQSGTATAPPPPGTGPPASVPPPGIGRFSSGSGTPPPYYPTNPQGSSPAPKRGMSASLVFVAVGVGLVLLLVAGVALTVIGSPHASPTLTAQASGTAHPVSTPTTARPTPTSAPSATSLAPTATASPPQGTPSPQVATASPTLRPTPSLQPTETAAQSLPPISEFDRLLALLDPSVGTCTEDIHKYRVEPATEALCQEGTYVRRYASFNTSDDLDTGWNWFRITSNDICNGYNSQTWFYNNISPDITRGRIACFTRGDLGTANPQLMFTNDDENILGVIIGDDTATVATLIADWDQNDGIVPPIQ